MRDLTPFVDELLKAYEQKSAFRPETEAPESLNEAYAVHSALMEAVGPVGGYKITQRPGQTPFVAPFPASRVNPSGAAIDRPTEIGLELEVGFVVIEDVPSPADPDFVKRLIASVRPAAMIEIVASRIEGDLAEDPYVKLADFQACEAVVVGEPLLDWVGDDFIAPDLELFRDDKAVHVGPGRVPGGSACAALAATVKALGSRLGGLQVGQRVLTGSLISPSFTRKHHSVIGRVRGLGEVTVRV